MAYTALHLVSYTLCLNYFVIAFPANGFVTDWHHLSSGLTEFRDNTNADWRKDGSQHLETKHKVFGDGDYDVIAPEVSHLAIGDSKLKNSEDKKYKDKHKMWRHIFPVLIDNPSVVRTTHPRSKKPEYISTPKASSDNDGEKDGKLVYGVLRILFPFRLKKHAEHKGTSSHDGDDDAAVPNDNRRVTAKSLELLKAKFRSLRKKRDSWSDEIDTIWKRLSNADAEEEVQKYDKCEMCSTSAKKKKRDTGMVSVETTTPTGIANISNNLNETIRRSENNTDDSDRKPISRLLDIEITTSQPQSTTSQHGDRKIENNHEEPRAETEMSLKSINVTTTEETGGPMGIEDDFAYVIDPQEVHLGADRDTASGKFLTSRGKIITLHWTIKFEPKPNSSGSGEHPHPPADDGRDVFEQVIYLDPEYDGSTEYGHTTDIPKDTNSEDSSEYLFQLPLPFGTSENVQTAEVPPVGQNEIPDIATVSVTELLSQKPITEQPEDWFTSQDGLLYPLDQSASNLELDNDLVDMEAGFPGSISPFQDEIVDMATSGEDYEPDVLLVEPVDTESESVYFEPNTMEDISSVLEVTAIPTVLDMELLSQQPIVDPTEGWFTPQDALVSPLDHVSSDIKPVDDSFDMESSLPATIPTLQDELVNMETAVEDYDHDALLSTSSPLDEPADMESDSAYFYPNTAVDIPSVLEVADIPAAPDMELVLQQPLTEPPGDWFAPQEELVHPLDQPSSDIALIDSGVDMEPELPGSIPSLQDELELIETAVEDYDPDALLSIPSSVDQPVDMESESAYFDPNTAEGIPSMLGVADIPGAPDMEMVLQQPPTEPSGDWFASQEELVHPLDQSSSDIALIDSGVDMEPELPGSIPSLQDELELIETAVEDYDHDALLSTSSPLDEPADMEPDSAYFDPNTAADIPSILEVADIPGAPEMELVLQEPFTEPPGDWFTPQDVLVHPLDQPSLDNVLIAGSFDTDTEITGSNPSLQDQLVDMELAVEDNDPDVLLSSPSSLDEPVDMVSEGAYFDLNTLADILSTLADADVETTELLVEALTGEQSEPPTLSSLDKPIDMQPELPVSLVEVSTGTQTETDTMQNIQSVTNEPDAFPTTAFSVYDEYGLEAYDGEDHGDHIDHTQESPCICRRSNTPHTNDRPGT